MSLHRPHRIPRILCCTLALALLCPTMACAVPATLHLPAAWYSVTTPYRYDESQRYAAGWHRGVDVRPADAVVRSVVSGVVRFAGTVAGRRIVTVLDAQRGIDLTYVGLDEVSVRVGQRLAAGDVLGQAGELHVGAYDAARRSHYIPIVGVAAATGSAAGPSLSGVIVDRVRSAVLGRPSMRGFAGAAPHVTDIIRPQLAAAHGIDPARTIGVSLGVSPRPPARGRGVAAPQTALRSMLVQVEATLGLPAPPSSTNPRLRDVIRDEQGRGQHDAVLRVDEDMLQGVTPNGYLPSGRSGANAEPSVATVGRPGVPGSVRPGTPRSGGGSVVAAAPSGSSPSAAVHAPAPRKPQSSRMSTPAIGPGPRESAIWRLLGGVLAAVALIAVTMFALRTRHRAPMSKDDRVATRTGIEVPLLVLPQPIEFSSPQDEERAAIAWSDPPPDDRARIPEHA